MRHYTGARVLGFTYKMIQSPKELVVRAILKRECFEAVIRFRCNGRFYPFAQYEFSIAFEILAIYPSLNEQTLRSIINWLALNT